jgi:hypothetical protein
MAAAIRSTTLKPSPDGGLSVEVSIADNADMALAKEVLLLAVRVPRLSANPSLTDIHRATLHRARAAIDKCMRALAPAASDD